MKGIIFIVHWNKDECGEIRESLTDMGFEVHCECEDGARAFRDIKSVGPDVVVVYLTKRPSHGFATAETLKDSSVTSGIPIFFVGGKMEKVDDFRNQFKDSMFLEEKQLVNALSDVLKGRFA